MKSTMKLWLLASLASARFLERDPRPEQTSALAPAAARQAKGVDGVRKAFASAAMEGADMTGRAQEADQARKHLNSAMVQTRPLPAKAGAPLLAKEVGEMEQELAVAEGGPGPLSLSDTNPGFKQIFYLHFPKCGSSFATVLAHHACGDRLAKDATLREPSDRDCTGGCPQPPETTRLWNQKCPSPPGVPPPFARFANGHQPLTPGANLQHVVAMFRDPIDRIVSGYLHYQPELDDRTGGSDRLHDCVWMREKYCNPASHSCRGDSVTDDGKHLTNLAHVPLKEYGECVGACMTNMLNGKVCAAPSSPTEVSAAVGKVDKLGFVGLTDEWNLSICLWHAMYGDPVLPAELQNLRPGVKPDSDMRYHDAMAGWQARDQPLYDEAKGVFWSRMQQYGVTRESCQALIQEVAPEHA